MAFTSSYRSRRYRSSNPYTRFSPYRSRGLKSRANGNQIAARQQRDSSTVTINRVTNLTVSVASADTMDDLIGVVVLNHYDSLRQSPFFANYSPMYDQLRIDKIRFKITGNSMASAISGANYAPPVILAFDRNGMDSKISFTSGSPTSYGPSQVMSYSSAQIRSWSTGNSFVMYQTIYPSTMAEKSQFIPISSLTDPGSITDQELSGSTNPCNIYSSPLLPFKPTTLLTVDTPKISTSGSTSWDYVFTAEIEYVVTFRGMRKPSKT